MSIKGFAITPVVLGRIGIGEIVENNNGKRLPRKINHIVLTGTHQVDGIWKQHPEMEKLIDAQRQANKPDPDKLRSIPVRIMFDKPENNFRAEYSCFNDKGRTICSGNGETAKRVSNEGVREVQCLGTDHCDFGRENRCKQFGRLIVGLESMFEKDPLSGFMFRTTSFNSIRSLTARLEYYSALMDGKMAGMPCNLVMRAKSTSASYRKPIFYLDLEPSESLMTAVSKAQELRKQWEAAGLKRDKLEVAVTQGIAESLFYEGGDDGEEIVEEFYSTAAMDDVPFSDDESSGKCSVDQAARIKDLSSNLGTSLHSSMTWLGHPADMDVMSLSTDDALRLISALENKLKKRDGEPGICKAKAEGNGKQGGKVQPPTLPTLPVKTGAQAETA